MTKMPLSLATARALKLDPEVLKILAPEEVARHAVVPLALERGLDALLVAVDPTASDKAEGFLRVRCEVRRVEAMEGCREAIAYLLQTHYFPYWKEKGWGFPGLPPVPGEEDSEGLDLVLAVIDGCCREMVRTSKYSRCSISGRPTSDRKVRLRRPASKRRTIWSQPS